MFGEKKIFVLRGIFSSPKIKQDFLKNCQRLARSRIECVFYEESGISRNDSLLKAIQNNGQIFEFRPLNNKELSSWIVGEFKKFDKKITLDGLLCLINFIGNDLWRLSNEIKKLSIYKAQERYITKEDVKLLVKEKIENDIFRTIEAIASQNNKKALSFILKHLTNGDSPVYLLSMITYQFRNLLAIKELSKKPLYDVRATLKYLHPFVVRKGYWQAKRFSLPQLKKIYAKLFKIDLFIKTGKIEPLEGLELLIGDLADITLL